MIGSPGLHLNLMVGGLAVVELNGVRIWAVAIEAGGATPARKLVCGTWADPLGTDEPGVPSAGPALPEWLAVPGRPDVAVRWTGWFKLRTGEVVGVYGATVEPVGGVEASDPAANLG